MSYSIEEQDALDKFRPIVSEYLKDKDDHYLLRWLRARDLNVEKAKEMLLENLEWRNQNPQLENINWVPPNEILDDIVYKFTGVDNDGRPILYMPVGVWNMRQLIGTGLKQEMLQYFYSIMEKIVIKIKRAQDKSGATEVVVLFDASQLTFWKIASVETMQVVKQFLQDFEKYYPEIINKIFVVNAHWVFYYAFKLVKSVIAPKTAAKIQILVDKHTWKSTLCKSMPAECIPDEVIHEEEEELKKSTNGKKVLMKHISCPP